MCKRVEAPHAKAISRRQLVAESRADIAIGPLPRRKLLGLYSRRGHHLGEVNSWAGSGKLFFEPGRAFAPAGSAQSHALGGSASSWARSVWRR